MGLPPSSVHGRIAQHTRDGASTLTAAEVDELRRAAAVGPIDPAVVGRVLEDHQRIQRERAKFVAILERLAPAWRELRSVLNELNRVLED